MSFGDRMDAHKEKLDQNKRMIDRVQNCIDNGAECNDWEDEFLGSIKDQLMQGRLLSERQLEALEKIEYLVSWGRDSYWEEFGHGQG